MRYIPAKHQLASIWVETSARSLSIEKDEACELYAKLCGFSNWKHMMLLIGNVPASLADEVVDEQTLRERRLFYISVLCGEYKVSSRMAIYISNSFSPSSGNIPRHLSIDLSSLYEEKDGHVYLENKLSVNSVLPDSLCGSLANSRNEVNSNSVRSSRQVFPSNWYVLAVHLGWDVIEDSCVEDYTEGEPSFWLLSNQVHRIPVFILPFTRFPEDRDDPLANAALRKIESRLGASCSRQAIVFWGGMLIKRIGNLDYTYPGVIYRDGKWHNFLLNEKMTQVQDLFDFLDHIPSVDRPHPIYADMNRELAVSFFLMCEGIESAAGIDLLVTSSGSGWGGLMSVSKI